MQSVQASLPGVRCAHYEQAAFPPEMVRRERSEFGLPQEGLLVLMNFDILSDPARKNPEAALAAFNAAELTDATLVVKLGNTRAHRKAAAQTRKLVTRLNGNPRTLVIDEDMTYERSLALTQCCDAYLSLHRSEGLGLNLLESMSLGTPVVCTAWSGNMDFCTPANSLLVNYDLVPIEATHRDYQAAFIGTGQEWAEPRIDSAANALRQLADAPELIASKAQQAERDMEARRAQFLEGSILREIELARADSDWEDRHDARLRAWGAIASISAYERAKRSLGAAARRMGSRR